MKTSRTLLTKGIALIGLVAVFGLAFSETKSSSHLIDLRALLLVFVAPLLVLLLFQKENLPWGELFQRVRETLRLSSRELLQELDHNTPLARGQYGFSHTVKMSENHSDSMVKYAGDLFSARFNSEEIAKLLVQKIQAEDSQWQGVCMTFGFLAKMAPYFGMLATVIGMIKLLENMTDFTRISGSMALAMQGTLYGLISFTVLYSPMQRVFNEARNQMMERNEMIARWFVLVAEQTDPAYIQQELRSLNFGSLRSMPRPVPGQVSPSPRSTS